MAIMLIFSKIIIDRAEIFRMHLLFNELSKNISHFVVAQNFVISTCLRMSTYTDFINFLEDGNRYRAEIFSVYSTFNKLSNGISFVFLA